MTPHRNTQADDTAAPAGERIAKIMARSGLCSRRDAEVIISEGRVAVNGSVIDSPALDIKPGDTVLVDGVPLAPPGAPRVWKYYKPKGRVTTHKDPEGRPTVFEALPPELPRLISVGRLDFNTEGLLLLTNDGDLARHLELPSTGWARRYRVRAHGKVEQSTLDGLADGLTVAGVHYGPIEAKLEHEQGDNVWIALTLREGKNREARRIMEHLGLNVNRLIRVSFGPFMLGEMETGQIEEVKTRILKDQLGPRLSRLFGVKREPLREERNLTPKAREGSERLAYLRRRSPGAKIGAEPARRRFEDDEPGPIRRRRILPMDGASGEPAKVEIVQEKPARKPFGERREGGREERPRRDGGTGFAARGEAGARPPRRDRDGESHARPDRPFRERASTSPRGSDAAGRERGREGGFETRAPGRSFDKRSSSERPPRRDGEKPFVKREPQPFGDRPLHARSAERPPRREGGKPFIKREPRQFGDKPAGARSSERPARDGAKPYIKREPREFGERSAEGRGASDRPPRREGGKPFVKREPRKFGDAPRESSAPAFRGERGQKPEGFRERRPSSGAPYEPRDRKEGGGAARKFEGPKLDAREGQDRASERPAYKGDRPSFRDRASSGSERPPFRPRTPRADRPASEDGRKEFRPRPRPTANSSPERREGSGRPDFKPSRTREEGSRPPFRKRDDGGSKSSIFRKPREGGGAGRPPSSGMSRAGGAATRGKPSAPRPGGGSSRPSFKPRENREGKPPSRGPRKPRPDAETP